MTTLPAELDATLASAAFIEDPFPVYRELRRAGSCVYSERLHGWLVTTYPAVRRALHNFADLSNFGWELTYLNRLREEVRDELPDMFAHFATRGLIYSDPPEHTRLRRLVGGTFLTKALEAVRPRVGELVDELLEQAPTAHFDLIRDVAYPLPTIVIAELFGVPVEDRGLFKGWSHDLTSFFGTADPDPHAARRANSSIASFRGYLQELVVARRAEPRDDLLTKLVEITQDGDRLDLGEILNTCVIFLVAGHETTTSLIGNTVLALANHPGVQENLRSDPARLADVIEETLRYDSPIQRVRRMVSRDFDFEGVRMRRGDAVFVLLGCANRDSDYFDEPDRFWPERPAQTHVAFGLGVHFCVGAALARLETGIAIGRLLAMAEGLEVSDGWQPEHNPSLTIRGLRELPLRF